MLTTPVPRVGIIGNMNNGGFAIMRYFRDLGVDAHLLLFANDGIGSLSHFTPEADTWDFERWAPYVRRTTLHNWTTSVVPDLRRRTWPPPISSLRRELSGFDRYVGSGAAPAIFSRAGLILDAFFPYSTGVEWIEAPEFTTAIRRSVLNRLPLLAMRRRQSAGVAAARVCLNAELGWTADVLARVAGRTEPLAIPAVYCEHESKSESRDRALRLTGGDEAPFRVLSSARLFFLNKAGMSEADWRRENKRSHFVFEGFRRFLDITGAADARLYVLEYGPDVDEAKALAHRLNLNSHVRWLPKLQRRDLTSVLKWCHASVGEFYDVQGTIWGGTGWEALAAGTPFVQSVNFSGPDYQKAFGHPLPPILDADSPDSVGDVLARLYRSPAQADAIGSHGRAWFNAHNGRSLAGRWLKALDLEPAEHPIEEVRDVSSR